MANKWLEHLAKIRAEHPELKSNQAEILKLAKETYNKESSVPEYVDEEPDELEEAYQEQYEPSMPQNPTANPKIQEKVMQNPSPSPDYDEKPFTPNNYNFPVKESPKIVQEKVVIPSLSPEPPFRQTEEEKQQAWESHLGRKLVRPEEYRQMKEVQKKLPFYQICAVLFLVISAVAVYGLLSGKFQSIQDVSVTPDFNLTANTETKNSYNISSTTQNSYNNTVIVYVENKFYLNNSLNST